MIAVADPLREGILVLSGYGLKLAMERGHLIVEDGIGTERRRLRFSRLDRNLKRVVVIGHAGTITLDAIRWLHGVGVPLVHLDTDGRVFLVASPSATIDPRLRRSQALACETGVGLRLSLDLVRAKIEAQRELLRRLPGSPEGQNAIDRVLADLPRATTPAEVRRLEALAARTYWGAWRSVSIHFSKRDAARVPRHWTTFGSRASVLAGSSSPRKATNPANALLNYLYAVLEAEMRIAALSAGLEPMLGLLHVDEKSRDSLVFDLMEPVRPAVDAFVLDFLAQHVFSRDELFELLDGQCRLLAPLTEQLATTAPRWARLALPEAQQLARNLLVAEASGSETHAVTENQDKRSRRPRRARRVVVREYAPRVAPHEDSRRSPVAGAKRRRAMAQVVAANSRWTGPRTDPAVFRADIWPKLSSLPLARLMRATGLTKSACSRIRAGHVIPHPRHWSALEAVSSA